MVSLDVTSEPEAHRGQDSVGELSLPARLEARIQRRAQHRGGHAGFDRRLHGPAPLPRVRHVPAEPGELTDRKSTRLNSSHSQISYAVFCLQKKKKNKISTALKVPSNQIENLLCHSWSQ